jgi:Ca2+-binding EF-hand superfamily protein
MAVALSLTWNPQAFFSQGYRRHPYQWTYQYGFNVPFAPPVNADPRTHHLWHQASQIFRFFDKDWNGRMGHSEFRRALCHTGYNVPEWEADRLFAMVDVDRSGKVTEQEFAEFWVFSHGGAPFQITSYGAPGYPAAVPAAYPAPMPGMMPGAMPGVMPGAYPPPVAYPPAYPPAAYPGAPMAGGAAMSFSWSPQYLTAYQRHPYQWNYVYGMNVPFQPPLNADPRTHHLWYQASQIFRAFDKDWNGRLSHKEFNRALNYTGYRLPEWETDRLFFMVDTDRSGKITEYEFAEFWVYAHGGSPFHLQSYQTTTTTTTAAYPGAPMPGVPMPGAVPYGGAVGVNVGVGGYGASVQFSAAAPGY